MTKTYYPPPETIDDWDICPGEPGKKTLAFNNQTGAVKTFPTYGKACDWANAQAKLNDEIDFDDLVSTLLDKFQQVADAWARVNADNSELSAYGRNQLISDFKAIDKTVATALSTLAGTMECNDTDNAQERA